MNTRSVEPEFEDDLLLRILEASPEELATIQRVLAEPPVADSEPHTGRSPTRPLPADGPAEANAPAPSRYLFRKVGRHWQVSFRGGRPFRLRNTLGARYLHYLLHRPNEPLSAFELELVVTPEKKEARVRDSIQPASDAQAKRAYREEMGGLQAKRSAAEGAADWEAVENLDAEMAALEAALQEGGAAPDNGERARDNVRKALALVLGQLRDGGPEEKAFAEHLRTHLSIGHECLYSQAEGRVWE
jgi:hypothetical protein